MSKEQGFKRSRLPQFTQEEIARIHNTSDFFGINSYTSNLVSRNDRNNSKGYPIPSFLHDMGIIEEQDDTWPKSGSEWLRVSIFSIISLNIIHKKIQLNHIQVFHLDHKDKLNL